MIQIRPYDSKYKEQAEKVLLESNLAKSKEDAADTLQEEIKKGDEYLIAEDGNLKTLGIVSGKTEGRPRHGIYELYHIGVVPEARGLGIAKQLFEALVDHAKKKFIQDQSYLRKFYLKTGEQNEGAHKFYQKMGMTQKDSLTEHFAKGRTELIFHLFFDEQGNKVI